MSDTFDNSTDKPFFTLKQQRCYDDSMKIFWLASKPSCVCMHTIKKKIIIITKHNNDVWTFLPRLKDHLTPIAFKIWFIYRCTRSLVWSRVLCKSWFFALFYMTHTLKQKNTRKEIKIKKKERVPWDWNFSKIRL